jgi:hypothetical protein
MKKFKLKTLHNAEDKQFWKKPNDKSAWIHIKENTKT